jgi:hypothetical protein
VGRDGDVGVQAEAFKPGTPQGGRLGAGGRAEAPEPAPGARAEGHAALQRGGDRLREERLLRRERVAAVVVLSQPAAARQEAPDAAVQPRAKRRDVGVGGRGQAVEDWPDARCRARVEAAEDERVEVNVGVQGAAEALNRGHGPAAGADKPPPGRAPPDPAEDGAEEHAQHG